MKSVLDLAAEVVDRARALGAQEVAASLSEGTSVQISRRDRRVEQATESATRSLSLSLLVDDRYSSHSTSDLRPDALGAFLERAVAATRYLEPDPARALAPAELCGRGATDSELDTLDPTYPSWTPEDRSSLALAMEEALLERAGDDFVSATAYVSDGSGRSAQVTSHGFADESVGAWLSMGGMVTLSEPDGRRPEGYGGYATRYRSDMPDVQRIANETYERAREAIGAGPIDSGKYPLILVNRSAGRILGTLSGPMSGHALHHGRSCLADRLGTRIGSPLLHITDDPTIPRGLGSTPWDDDMMVARPRMVVEDGVLQLYYLDVYYARKLGQSPTTGSRSNWVVRPGEQPWQEVAKAWPKAILVTGFLGGNANGVTGDFSFGVRGRLLEHGEPTTPLSEMNVTGNTLTIFDQLVAVGDDPWLYSSTRSPTLVFDDVQFSGV